MTHITKVILLVTPCSHVLTTLILVIHVVCEVIAVFLLLTFLFGVALDVKLSHHLLPGVRVLINANELGHYVLLLVSLR